MASGERGWEEAINRAVQGAVRSVLTDREASTSNLASNQFSPPSSNATSTGTSSVVNQVCMTYIVFHISTEALSFTFMNIYQYLYFT